jgi:hypothetical protein
LLIDGLGNNATLDHFTLDSKGGEPVYFAGHVIDFSLTGCNTPTSQWVGGGMSDAPPCGPCAHAPEPSTLALAMIGLVGLTLVGLARRRLAAKMA